MPRRLVLIVGMWVCAVAAGGQKPLRLFVEGEDFQVVSGDWKVVPYPENYFASTFAVTFLSRMACLGAPAQLPPRHEAKARCEIQVPRAGRFLVFARYEQPLDCAVEFTVQIEQGGEAVYRETFGRLDDPKIWAFNNHQRVPMHRYSWGGTDNIVWQQKGSVGLKPGRATVWLIAGPQLDGKRPRERVARRHVDVICLTDDRAGLKVQREKARYLELDGWLTQAGDLFVRFTNPRDGLGPCVPLVAPFVRGQHSPYWVHVRDWPTTRVVRDGRMTSPTAYEVAGPRSRQVRPELLARAVPWQERVPDDQYLQPGETSGWVAMGQVLDALNNSVWCPQALYHGRKDKMLDLVVEFAVPDGKGGLKPVWKGRVKGQPGPVSLVAFEMPGNVASRPLIRTQLEALGWLLAEVKKFPKVGPPPRRFPIYGLMGFSSATRQDNELGKVATELAIALGDNTLTPLRGPWVERLGIPPRKTAIVAHWPPSNMERFRQRVEQAKKQGTARHIGIVSYGDEIHIPPARGSDAEFATWLKVRGVNYRGPVHLAKEPSDPLYYYSRLWALEKGIAHYAAATRFLEEQLGKDTLTGANYSPHINYLVDDIHWVRPFKVRAMTMPWSEDYVWAAPEFSVQVTGYLVSAFRCGAKYHDLPIMMYVMPHSPGNTPRDFRLSFYTAIAHGARKINYFCASPLAVAYTENYIRTDDLAMWRAVHRVTHEAGVFEDYVLDGRVRPARVALLLSSTDDILGGASNFEGGIHNLERQGIYFALRHAQVPVDFITEDDVLEGRAKDYRVIYLTQEHIHSRALAALARWVEAGGTLVALCGGGFLDEFRKPNPQAAELYGARGERILKDPALPRILPKQDLPTARPIDTAQWGRGMAAVAGVEVIAWKQPLAVTDGKVIGTFSDGSPAVVEKPHGKGRAVLFGFLPGVAYMKSGLPVRPLDRGATDASYSHFPPTDMNARLRAALADAFLPPDYQRPVVCSEPLVETTVIETTKPPRLGIPLVNYTGKPIANLTVKVRGVGETAKVRSVVRGGLKPEFVGGTMVVRLPLAVADVLLIDR